MIDNLSLVTPTFIRNNNCFYANNKNIIPVHTIVPNTNKFAPNTNKGLAKNAITVYDTTLFPLSDQILPHWYKRKLISHSESLKLISETDGIWSKADQLVYKYPQQMPTDKDDNGWKNVFWQSTSPGPIKINTRNNEVIELEWLPENQPVVSTITTVVPYFIDRVLVWLFRFFYVIRERERTLYHFLDK